MSTPHRNLHHLVKHDSGFAMTVLSVVAFTVIYTYLFGPSPEVALSMLGVLVTTAVIEFRHKPPQ